MHVQYDLCFYQRFLLQVVNIYFLLVLVMLFYLHFPIISIFSHYHWSLKFSKFLTIREVGLLWNKANILCGTKSLQILTPLETSLPVNPISYFPFWENGPTISDGNK